jgi:sulfite reductase (NADPH) flavoprotein alpha-component
MYSRDNPFLAQIKERTSLCAKESVKLTEHIVLDIKGSGLTYNVGDCLAILPPNASSLVEKILFILGMNKEFEVMDRRTKTSLPLMEFLQKRANLKEASGKLKKFAEEEQEKISVLNLVEAKKIDMDPQSFCDLLSPQLPRYYSIASSMAVVGEEVHLTVSNINCKLKDHKLYGLCTDFLCTKAPLEEPVIPSYIHPHRGFTLPEDASKDIVMIGPGTGVAPFRAFLQERERLHDSGVSVGRNWLFFGECHKAQHFFYQDYWFSLIEKGILQLDVAFSRDQEEKLYVQHCMAKKAKELLHWIEKGAYIYVCGDAEHMAKDVEATLLSVISQEHFALLKKEKRYLRDVY